MWSLLADYNQMEFIGLKILKLLLISMMLLLSSDHALATPQQDHQSFFFGQQPQQRFLPSTFQHRNNFLSSNAFPSLGTRNTGDTTGTTHQDTSSSFGSFGSYQTTPRTDYYELSPRPFSVSASSSQFGRPQSARHSGGFVPQKSGRSNVPHQQSQFLAHFNDQPHLPEKPSTTNRAPRPFGNSNFSRNRLNPSHSRPTSSNEDVFSTQQQLPFRNSRNRFHPSAERTTTQATTATSPSTTERTHRYNRFGSGRSGKSSSLSTTTPRIPAKPNKSIFQPRRPVFISREVNEPVHLRPRPLLGVKVNSEHNESNKVIKDESEIVPEQDVNETNNLKNKFVVDEQQPEIPENLVKSEKIKAANPQDTSENAVGDEQKLGENTVILTSNFFLPDGSLYTQEEYAEGEQSSDEQNNTTTHPTDYEYEYEDYEEKPTTLPTTSDKANTEIETERVPETEIVPETERVPETQKVLETEKTPDTEVETEAETQPNINEEQTDVVTDSTEANIEQTTQIHDSESTESSTEYDDDEDGEDDDDDGDDDVEDDDEHDNNQASVEETSEETSQERPEDILGKAVVSVVTTKSVINGSTAHPKQTTTTLRTPSSPSILSTMSPPSTTGELDYLPDIKQNTTESSEKILTADDTTNNATESWVVVASIQTSRSISGTRFLPFPDVEQEEKKQTLSELHEQKNARLSNKNISVNQKSENDSVPVSSKEVIETTTVESITVSPVNPEILTSTEKNHLNQSISTESIIDKLDRVQSELSGRLLTGKFPILNEMLELQTPSSTRPTTTTSKFSPVFIRKFTPKSTTSKPDMKKIDIETIPMDDLSGLLPPGFKPRQNSYRNKKLTTTTTETPRTLSEIHAHNKPFRNATIGRSFKNTPVGAQDVSVLLPKGYKLNTTFSHSHLESSGGQKNIKDILTKIKFEDNLDKVLPRDYREKSQKSMTTKKPNVTTVDDYIKFLPPGYKQRTTPSTTTRKPAAVIPIKDDFSNLLPPGYKPPAESTPNKSKPSVIPISDDLSKFLPPGFKLDSSKKEEDKVPVQIDISKLLPKDFKPTSSGDNNDSVLKKIEFKDVSSLLPPGYKLNTSTTSQPFSPSPTSGSTTTEKSNLKVIFPKGGFAKRPGVRLTTPKSSAADGPSQPTIVIKKGPPVRVTTEFTGWPTPSTTPISIEKLLEQQNAAAIDISELLPKSTTTTTTTTTTTSTEPPRPTEPGLCRSECDLAGTIKIIDGVQWKPELLDHNTDEWKNLAREVEAQLNEVYSKAPHLSKWYKKVRIDSFNKGSVLVDYFVELSNISRDVDTLEIRRLFHDALTAAPVTSAPQTEQNEDDNEDTKINGKGEKLVKETYLLGRFVVDPVSTDFIVIQKTVTSYTPEFAEEDVLPQWAIVVIVVGVGSLCFIVVFGVTVLVNRQKRSKKTPTPLTNDMLNELNKNHMGGADNYGADEFYNIDDAWGDTKQPIKPKRFTNSMHGSSASNIYDSWRSQRHGDYYYDSHNYTPHKTEPYPAEAFTDAHQMYTYNNSRSRYHRDYDPDF